MRLPIALLILLLASACAEHDTLPHDEWGTLVKVLDRVGAGWLKTSPRPAPVLELGSLVYAKVVIGGVDVRSSDPDVVEVVGVEEKEVGTWCDPWIGPSGERDCGPDFDTWFTLRAISIGDTQLIVTAHAGGTRRLPLSVASAATADIVRTDDYLLFSEEEISGDDEEREEALVLGGTEFPWPALQVALDLQDTNGRQLTSHLIWTFDDPSYAEFVYPDGPPEPTSDTFELVEAQRHEGPAPSIRPLAPGITILKVETSAGRTIEIPLWVAISPHEN